MGHSVLCNLFTKQKDFTLQHKCNFTKRKERKEKETCKENLFIVQKRLSSCHSSFSFTKTIASFKACKHNAAKAKDQLGHKVSKRESVTIVKWVIVLNDGQSNGRKVWRKRCALNSERVVLQESKREEAEKHGCKGILMNLKHHVIWIQKAFVIFPGQID